MRLKTTMAPGMILWALSFLLVGSAFAQSTNGSLWNEREGFRYTNRRAIRVGDLITVMVNERASGSNQSTLSTSKEHKVGFEGGPGGGKLDFIPMFNLNSSMKNESDGSGSVSLSGNLSTTLTAVVREVRPNGYLVVEGSRVINLNGEEDRMSFHGVARPEDVRSDNSIESTRLSEVSITYDGEGLGKSATRPGFFQRILSWVF